MPILTNFILAKGISKLICMYDVADQVLLHVFNVRFTPISPSSGQVTSNIIAFVSFVFKLFFAYFFMEGGVNLNPFTEFYQHLHNNISRFSILFDLISVFW